MNNSLNHIHHFVRYFDNIRHIKTPPSYINFPCETLSFWYWKKISDNMADYAC